MNFANNTQREGNGQKKVDFTIYLKSTKAMITTNDFLTLPNGIKDHKNCLRNVNGPVKQLSFSYFELENAPNSTNKTKNSTYPKLSKNLIDL